MGEVENSQRLYTKARENRQKCYEFDDLLKLTGGFGRYQLALYIFICVVSIPTGAQLLVQVFYGAPPRFSCVSMPRNETCDPGKCYSNCLKYEFHGPFSSAVSEVMLHQCIYVTSLSEISVISSSIRVAVKYILTTLAEI